MERTRLCSLKAPSAVVKLRSEGIDRARLTFGALWPPYSRGRGITMAQRRGSSLVALGLVLLSALALAALATSTPRPLPVDAAADLISAGRAARDIATLASVPHPVGSPQNAQVRQELVARLRGLGLSLEVRETVHAQPFRLRPIDQRWTVYDVLARIAGRDPRAPALLVMSHYDSVPRSPGAADDMAGVASALEMARMLRARQPVRDVVFAFTDGEEAGLIGANALFSDPTFVKRIGFVVNMEARGGGGRALMYQTGPDERGAEQLFAAHPRGPNSNSLAAFIYRVMPNNTDLTVALAHDLPGLNYAFIGRPELYHTPIATPARVEKGAVQSLGQQAWAVVEPMAYGARLPAPGPDLTWFDLFGVWVIAYPQAVGWAPVGAGLSLLAFAVYSQRRQGNPVAGGLLVGAGQSLVATALAALAVHLYALLALHGYYHALARARWTEVATIAAALTASMLVFRLPGTARPLPRWAGAVALAWAISLLLQLLAPQTAFIAEWPMLLSALALAERSTGQMARSPVAGVCAVVALGFLFELWHELILGVGVVLPVTGAALLPLMLSAVAPFLFRQPPEDTPPFQQAGARRP